MSYGHARLGEQHVHVAGQPAGDRVNREPDVDPPFAQELGDLEERMLRLGDRHAVAGDDDHAAAPRAAAARSPAAVMLLDLARRAAAPAAGAAPFSAPNPPRMTLRNERFIAAHMM